MPKTKVINGTGQTLTLKEGTAGIFTTLTKLQPNEFYQIVVDKNATYREYWCAVKTDDPDGGVVLSSDDCQDLKEVTITETVIGTTTSYSYTEVSRESGEPSGGLFAWFRSFFRKPGKGSSSKSQPGNSGDSSVV